MLAYHSMPTQSDLSATQSVLQYLTAVHVSAGILTRLVCHAHSWHEIVLNVPSDCTAVPSNDALFV